MTFSLMLQGSAWVAKFIPYSIASDAVSHASRTIRSCSTGMPGAQQKFVITGPAALDGEIEVLGSKNAVLPIIAASLLTEEPCTISNVPHIEDVYRMLEMVESMGAKIFWQGSRRVVIEARHISLDRFNISSAQKLRASVLLFGPLLARLGRASLPYPGGDHIGRRPLDAHLNAFRDLGATVRIEEDVVSVDASRGFEGKEVILGELSVTATENVLMALSRRDSKTTIRMAALEPHVQDLIRFLKKLGVSIRGAGTHTLDVGGSSMLGGAVHSVIFDPIEAGTFLVLGALAKGGITIRNVDPSHLDQFLKKLRDTGVRFETLPRVRTKLVDVRVIHSGRLKSFRAQTLPFPGIPTDLQALLGLLATQADGRSLVHDPLYENRFNYARELEKMGARVTFLDPHRTEFLGPTSLKGVPIKSFDLRAGATLIVAGLIAKGTTTIHDAYQVDRGYEKIEERLQAIGAGIKRVDEE